MSIRTDVPEELVPVLAEIAMVGELATSSVWYEVVYYDQDEWHSYAGSDTFETAGDRVLRWEYVDKALEHRTAEAIPHI